MLTYTEFLEYYRNYGKTPYQVQMPKKELNDRQLKKRYAIYVRAEYKKQNRIEKQQEKQFQRNQEKMQQVDEQWEKVKKLVYKRDHYRCQLLPRIPDEYVHLRNNLGPLDPCHVFRRSTHPFLKYDPDNIVTLHRLFHNRLDQYRHPFTGESISHDETYQWWRDIIGSKRFHQLKEKINEQRG